MYLFVEQIKVWLNLLHMCWLPPDTNAVEATGKLIQEVTTAFYINKLDPFL